MSDSGPLLESRSIWRALTLGIVVFLVFCLIAGLLWLLSVALGMEPIPAFLVGTCAAPLLVGGGLALWLTGMPLERRQKMLGVGPTQTPGDTDQTVE